MDFSVFACVLFGDFESKVNYKQRRYKNEYKLPGVILDECAIDDCKYTQNDSEDDGIVVLTTVPDGIEDKKQDKRRRNEANENDPRAAADDPENDEEKNGYGCKGRDSRTDYHI